MKRYLLASTMLVSAVAFAGVAQAADVSISGSYEVQYTNHDIDDEGDKNDIANDPGVVIGFSDVTDTGISLSYNYEVEDDHTNFTVSGDFGALNVYTDGDAVSGLDVDVDGLTPDEAHGLSGVGYAGGFGGVGGTALSYTLPTFVEGLTLAVSHRNEQDNVDGIGYGATFSGSAGDLGYKVAVTTRTNGDGDGTDTTQDHIGLSLSTGAWSLLLERNNQDVSDDSSDYSSQGFGGSYNAGALKLRAYQRTAETDNADGTVDDYSQQAVSATYTIASGLSASVTQTTTEWNEESSNTIALALDASF